MCEEIKKKKTERLVSFAFENIVVKVELKRKKKLHNALTHIQTPKNKTHTGHKVQNKWVRPKFKL